MGNLIKEIETLINSINTDTSRKQLPDLCIKLIELSKIYWNNKRDYIEYKTKYNIIHSSKIHVLNNLYKITNITAKLISNNIWDKYANQLLFSWW